jgi:hypothetical protein
MATANPFEPTAPKPQSNTLFAKATEKAGGQWMGVESPYADAFNELSKGSQFSASQASFDEAKGAAGRVAEITSKDSPLMQRAQGRAAQAMNARGLSNSSMAVGAAESAVIDAATPLAQTDAQLYQQTNLENARLATQAAAANAQARTQVGLDFLRTTESGRQFGEQLGLERDKFGEAVRQFDTEQSNNMSRFDRELAEKGRQFDTGEANQSVRLQSELASRERLAALDNQTRLTVANLDATTRKDVATLENNWRLELSRNERIAGAWGTMMERIGQIQNNKDLEPGTKQQLIQQNMDLFAAFANFSKKLGDSPIDVSDLLDFSTRPGGGAGSSGGNSDPIPGDAWTDGGRGQGGGGFQGGTGRDPEGDAYGFMPKDWFPTTEQMKSGRYMRDAETGQWRQLF